MTALLTLTTLTVLRLMVPFGLVLLLGTLLERVEDYRPRTLAAGN